MARILRKTKENELRQIYDKQIYGVDVDRGIKCLELAKQLIPDMSEIEQEIVKRVFERLDYNTCVHCLNVSSMGKFVVNDLGSDFESTYGMRSRDFIMSALLHDVGKCSIDDFILKVDRKFEDDSVQ